MASRVETEENALFRNVATMDLLFFVKYGKALGISVGRSLGTATVVSFVRRIRQCLFASEQISVHCM
jgi:hypothetical protein